MSTRDGRPIPYIGVTGFCSPDEVAHAIGSCSFRTHHLMVGVLASWKTLYGRPADQPRRYPDRSEFATLFPDDARTLGLLHYHTRTQGDQLVSELLFAHSHCFRNPGFDGFQLNIRWPDPRTITMFHRVIDDLMPGTRRKIVLQCGAAAMEDVGMNPSRIAQRVRDYEGIVDYVLIDPSGGTGTQFDPAFARACFRALYDTIPTIGIGIAGGLNAQSLEHLAPLIEEFGEFSIDAEGRLRTPDDALDQDAVVRYLRAAESLFPTVMA